ncbi:hypothetical protein [Micromonospora sp. S-DT3-3-22]|uniref:hypothetical protein n=1 Tax=Micromonospora sp. S-DT3-3-22 TaxID=2755359 RepID=UPI00188EA5DE|nr:hypothetical protein [Micromonospora sp. S-DT3-3-22]
MAVPAAERDRRLCHGRQQPRDIVGYGGYLEEPVTLRWPVDRPDTVEVLEPGGIPVAVLDDGTIVGEVPAEEDRSSHGAGARGAAGRGVTPPPVAWVRRPDGRIDRLTAPGAVKSTVRAARGNWAIGQVADTADGEYRQMVRWDLRTGVATPVRPGLTAMTGVKAAGGLLSDSVVDHLDRRVPLRSAVSGPVTRVVPEAIADNGLVVGRAAGPQVSGGAVAEPSGSPQGPPVAGRGGTPPVGPAG